MSDEKKPRTYTDYLWNVVWTLLVIYLTLSFIGPQLRALFAPYPAAPPATQPSQK